MMTTPKTDLFKIRLECAADKVIYLDISTLKHPKFKSRYFRALQESYLFLKYHLYGIYNALPSVEQVEDKNDSVYPDVLEYVLSQPITSYKSVGEEFYAMTPTPCEIEEYLQIFRVKFKSVFLPNRSVDNLILDAKYQTIINDAQAKGFITQDEADFLIWRLLIIIKGVNEVWEFLVQMFNDYKEMIPSSQYNTEPTINQDDTVINEAILKLCPDIIPTSYEYEIRNLFTNGRSAKYISIKPRKFTAFFRIFYPLWSSGVIPQKHYQSEYLLIQNSFKIKDKDISIATINSAKNSNKWM